MNTSLFLYTLHLADNALILGQRNSEWCGHGPVLEQDIAITNISLDLLGQARNFYALAAEYYNGFSAEAKEAADRLLPRPWKAFGRELNEDDLAFLRDERQYTNLLLTELPKGDWAVTVTRQFFFSAWQYFLYDRLCGSGVEALAAIAEKSLKEVTYHLRWSSEWVVRLGDGTEESRQRVTRALEALWPYRGEPFIPAPFEEELAAAGLVPDGAGLKAPWLERVQAVLEEATLRLPAGDWAHRGGKEGRHTEHLGYLLTEMQYLQRAYPNAAW